jgi:hypothetical protein
MNHHSTPENPDVFISYASKDRDKVLKIVEQLETKGIRAWVDREKISGGANYGPEIVKGIKTTKILMLMCSDASMRSKNVKQEIQLAWKYDKPYLPILLEPISFPEQVEYWLEGWQWLEVLDKNPEDYLPGILKAIGNLDITVDSKLENILNDNTNKANYAGTFFQGLKGIYEIAKYTDRIWTISADSAQRGMNRGMARGLGAPQDDVKYKYPLGSEVCIIIEPEKEGYLLLLDDGPEGVVYCLCPSLFAPSTRIRSGRTCLPPEEAKYNSFKVTGKPGREHLLAIITEKPFEFDWLPQDERIPARQLNKADIELLLTRLKNLEGNQWMALATYFDIVK